MLSFVYGIALSLLNVVAGFRTAKYAFKHEVKKSISIVLGGMAIRIAVSVLIMAAMYAFTEVDRLPFTLAFVISYFVMLMFEIVYINKRYTENVRKHRAKILAYNRQKAAQQSDADSNNL